MKVLAFASVSAAALMAVGLIDVTPAEARSKGFSSFSGSRMSTGNRPAMRLTSKPIIKSTTSTTLRRTVLSQKKTQIKNVTKLDKAILKKGPVSGFVSKTTLKPGNFKLGKLPVQKAVLGKANLVGRLAVPKTIKPKLTLVNPPKANFQMRFAPFVQRHWKKAFFWVALAGVGYVTVPELYYDRFYTCTNGYDPDYDECIRILSYAAVEEEDEVYRVRRPMPVSATYRHIAKVAPTTQAVESCSLTPFVERQWNRSFVWVQIPETGNVTVPEDFYDRFYGQLGDEPPNYAAACKVLVEAAAADTVATTGLDLERRL
jgi:hypothetical protein